jgi:hypothetical protein
MRGGGKGTKESGRKVTDDGREVVGWKRLSRDIWLHAGRRFGSKYPRLQSLMIAVRRILCRQNPSAPNNVVEAFPWIHGQRT